MKFCKQFLIILLILFFVSLAGVSASEALGDGTSIGNESVSQGTDDVQLDVLSSGENDVSSVADEDQSVNENAVADEGQAENEILGASGDTEVLGATQLPNTISSSQTWSQDYEIRHTGNLIRTYYTTSISGSSAIVIDGNSHSVDGLNQKTIFHVTRYNTNTPTTVTFRDITFMNGNGAEGGGAVKIDPGCIVTFENCKFIDNTAKGTGGAIQVASSSAGANDQRSNSQLSIISCVFERNSITTGSGDSFGGALAYSGNGHAQSSFYMNNCNFTGHTSVTSHSIMQVENVARGKAQILNCRFESNSAPSHSTVCVDHMDGIIVDNCIFKDNVVGGSNDGNNKRGGAGIYVRTCKDVTLTNCQFIHNTVNGAFDGGAVYAYDGTTFTEITSCKFERNSAQNGAGIFIADSQNGLVFSDCSFTDNAATVNGGAVYMAAASTNLQFNNCNFTDNSANFGGAVFLPSGSNQVTFFKDNFNENTANANHGGAIFMGSTNSQISGQTSGDYFTVNECNFTNNKANNAANWGMGGAICLLGTGNHITITNDKFDHNEATSGAAIQLFAYNGDSYSDVTISDCDFTNNNETYADSWGGSAITFNRANGVDISDCRFEGNTAKDSGAIFFDVGSDIEITGSNFTANHADSKGAAIFMQNGATDITVNKCIFTKNSADDGGAIYTPYEDNKLKISECSFKDNTARDSGAIHLMTSTANTRLYDCNFTNNSASNYAALYVEAGNGFTIDNCLFDKNNATSYYTVYFSSNGGSVKNSNFTNNTAESGSGIHVFGGSSNNRYSGCLITDCDFIGNHATGANGKGAVEIDSISSLITKSEFINNTAGTAAAIYATGSQTNITDSSFVGNKATGDAGAIYFASSGGNIKNCDFTNNTAENGGAVVFDSDHINVINCDFTKNNATLGGAIYLKNPNQDTVEDSTFEKNYALNGGAIYDPGNEGASLLIKNDTFIENVAKYNGGAVFVAMNQGNLKYRDFNDFNNEGTYTDNRLDWTARYNSEQVVIHSFFKDNVDYYYNVTESTMSLSPTFTVTIPKSDLNKGNVKINITIVDDNGNVHTYTYQPPQNNLFTEYDDHYVVTIKLEDQAPGKYNATVGFESLPYLYKEQKVNFTIEDETKGEFTLLQELIDKTIRDAEANHVPAVLNLTGPYSYTIGYDNGQINITKPITINGGHFVLDAKGMCSIFYITAPDVVLNNIVFVNGNASGINSTTGSKNGGAILWEGNNGTIIDSEFTNNNAEFGGAVFVDSNSVNTTIESSLFINNTATHNGGAVDWNASTGSIVGSEFYNNTADENGGAVFVGAAGGESRIVSSTFKNNSAINGRGGAVDWYASHGNIEDSTFEDNHAQLGGAVFVGSKTDGGKIINSTFRKNTASDRGGAIDWNATSGHIEDSHFFENTADYGGAVFVGSKSASGNITNSEFADNVANEKGGAIDWFASSGNIYTSNFTNNRAAYGGAVFVGKNSTNALISESIFTNNTATYNGGAIDWNATGGNVTGSQFYDNVATNGGAIFVGSNGTSGHISNSKFEGNNATGGRGGAVDWYASSGEITNSNFTNNHADYGGAVFVGIEAKSGNIVNSIFTGNDAVYNGGAVDWNATNGKIEDSKFYNNTANNGGAVFVGASSGQSNITDSTFEGNNATGRGGAVDWYASSGEVYHSTFTNNMAHDGGAIFVGSQSEYGSITLSTFTNNVAANKGGAVDWNASKGNVKDSTFEKNSAEFGGAIFVGTSSEHSNITGSTFNYNVAGENGGAVDFNASNGQIYDSKFDHNSAKNGGAVFVGAKAQEGYIINSNFTYNNATRGGAVDWNASEGYLEDSTFENNEAVDGGALYVGAGAATAHISNDKFKENSADNNGGAIFLNGVEDADVYNSEFIQNRALDAGAIYITECKNFLVNDSDFESNVANSAGGAIVVRNADGNITYSTFESNKASGIFTDEGLVGGHGGAIYINEAEYVNITDATFNQNSANMHGGDICVNKSDDILLYNIETTSSKSDDGASLYIDSNVTIEDAKFNSWTEDMNAVVFVGGNSTMVNSAFAGNNPVMIKNSDTIVYLTENNNTAAESGDYSVYNEGELYLSGNIFSNVIINDGHIKTQTYTRVLDGQTVVIECGDDAELNATIVDDNENVIVVKSALKFITTGHEINSTYSGRANYGTFVSPAKGVYIITVNDCGLDKNDIVNGTLKVKEFTTISIDTNKSEDGQSITINATISPDDAEGKVIFTIKGNQHEEIVIVNLTDVVGGYAVLTLENLIPDTYIVTANYTGDDKHFESSTWKLFTIFKRDSNVSVQVENIFEGQTAVAVVTTSAVNGTVTIVVNGKEYEVEINGGSGTCNIENLTAGSYSVQAFYDDNDYYKSSKNKTNFTVYNYDMTVEANDTEFNQSTKIVITLPDGVTGNNDSVVVYVNGTEVEVTTLDGKTYVGYTDNLDKVGQYVINATYLGDATHDPINVNDTKFNVNPLSNYEFNVTVTPAPFGEDTVIVVTAPAGIKQVNLTVDGTTYVVNLTDGVGQKVLNNLTAGNYVAAASFAGNENYTAHDASDDFTVAKADSAMTIIVPDSPVAPGSAVEVTVVVGKNATKKVIVYVNDEAYVVPVGSDGNATLTINNVQPGEKVITAEYMGDDNYKYGEGGPADFTVAKYNTTIDADYDVDDSNSVVINVTLNVNTTGNVTVNGVNYTVTNGFVSVDLGPMSQGHHDIDVIYCGDDMFNTNQTTVSFDIGKLNNGTMTVDITTPVEYGNTATITVTVPDVTDGNVTVWVDDVEYNATKVSDGVFEVVTDVLPAGDYVVNVTYYNSTKYNNIASNGNNLTVKKNDSYVLDVTVSPAPYGEVTNITVTGPANATVTVTVDGVEYNVTLNENGTGVKALDNLTAGTHSVAVTYGDDNYTNKSDFDTFTIPKAASSADVTVDKPVAEAGDDVTISVKVPSDATGQVNIKVNGQDNLVNVTDGYANLTLSNVDPNNYTVVATYLGDSNYNASAENTTEFKVNRMNTTIKANATVLDDNSVVITVQVNENATGEVYVEINGTKYSGRIIDGNATIVLPALANGTYTLDVTYDGDDNYNGNSTPVEFTVDGLNNYTMDVQVIPGKHNETSTIIVQLPAGADGNVTVYVNGTPNYPTILPNGTAIVEVVLPAGVYEVNVTYSNSTQYDPRDINGTPLVVGKEDKYPLEVDVDAKPYGENTTITVTAPSDVAQVNVTVDGVTYTVDLTDGVGTKTLNNLTAGKHEVTASYAGDDNYTESSNTTTFDIPKAASVANVTVDKAVAEAGDDVTISVKVPSDATGQVNIKVNGVDHLVDVEDGYANLTLSNVDPNNYTVVATYLGDSNYNKSAENATEFEVNRMNTTIKANVTVLDDNSVVITVQVNENATGEVYVEINGTKYSARIIDGNATIVLPALANGTYTLDVTYDGDDNYNGNSTPVEFTVDGLNNYTMDVQVIPGKHNETSTIIVQLPAGADGNVTVYVNGTPNYPTILPNGTAIVEVVLPAGVYEVNVTYSNSTKYDPRDINGTPLVVDKQDKYPLEVDVDAKPYGENTTITVTAPSDVAQVNVTVDGVTYTVDLTDGVGTKTLNNLTAGKHEVTASYAGDDNYTASSNATTFDIPKAASAANVTVDKPVAEAGDNVTISVKVPEDATGQVNIKVDGVDHLINVENGYANVTLNNVKPGDYPVVVKYLGDANYNASAENATSFTVNKMTHDMNATPTVHPDNSVTIAVELDDSINDGNVTVLINGTPYNATVKHGIATIEIPNLSNGTYDVDVVFSGNHDFESVTEPVHFVVDSLANTTMTVDITTPTEYGNQTTITVTIPDVTDGNVTVWIGKDNYTAEYKGNGVFELVTPVLPAGVYNVNVTYTNGSKYGDMREDNLSLTVTKNDSYVLDVDVDAAPYGEVTNITVTGPANATVTVTVDGVEYNVTLDENGTGVKALDNLTAGTHSVAVTNGDDNYTNKTDFATFNVPKAASAAEVTIDKPVAEAGDDVTISVKVPADATGQVNIKVNGQDNLVNVTDGYANLTLSDVDPDNYTVVAKYLGDANYNASAENATEFEVNRMNTTIKADATVLDDNSVVITVQVNENATGDVYVEINGTKYSGRIIDGNATIVLPALANGTYALDVTYDGDDNYNGNATPVEFTVDGLNNYTMDVQVIPGKHNETSTIIVQLPAGADGNVTVYVNGTPNYPTILPNGTAIVEVVLPAGVYEVNVTYSNSTQYDPRDINGTPLVVGKEDKYPLEISVDEKPYGENTTITVTAPSDVAQVNVTVDGVTYTVDLTDGVGTKTLNNLTAGKHEVIASYAGDKNYTASSNTTTFNVPKAASDINVTVDDRIFDAGEDVLVEVEINKDATGQVNINIDGVDHMVNITDGKASYTLKGAQPGKHNITVTYAGDDNYNGSSATDDFTVDTFPTDMTVTPEFDENNNVTLYVKVNKTATGNVTVKVGDKTYNGTVDPETGIAAINIGVLTNDTEVLVTYEGDDKFNETAKTEMISVPSLVNYTLPVTSEDITYGEVAQVNVTLPDGANADNVKFYVDGVETAIAPVVSGNTVQLNIPDLAAGDHTVEVRYLDDGKYANNTNSTTFTVGKQNATAIDKEINVTDDIHVGEVANITVKLPNDANGTITVNVNGINYVATVVNGTANVSIPNLGNGTYDATIVYSGDDNYEGFTETATIVVEKVEPTISANTTEIKLGENAVINVTVDDDATGTVTIKVAGIEQTVAVAGGLNSIIVPDVPVGDHTVEVIYNGNDKYSNKSTTTQLVVKPKDTTPDDIRVIDNGDGTITVIVPENATGNVTVKIGNETLPVENITDGKAIVNLTKSNATPGEHNITVIYSGDGNHTPAEVNATAVIPKWDSEITANVSTIREGDDAVIIVEVAPKDATGPVRVYVDGKGYVADVIDGIATITVPGLSEGTYDVKVTYDGDDTYNGDNTTAQITVQAPIKVEVNGTGNESQVIIELPTNDTGNSNITVKIDGVERNFTVENGTVKANLTGLEPGEHNLTVIYTDENNVTSVVETKIIVPKWDSEVNATADTIREGDDATVVVSVGPDMTGSVRVDINGSSYIADIENGKAVVTVPGLKEGTYEGVVTYLGDDKYDPSNNTFSLTVQAPIKVDVNGTGNESQVIIELPTNDTGNSNITVKIDGVERNFTVENGTVKANLTGLEPGEHNLTVIYTDENNVTSVVETKIVVPKWDSEVNATADTIREGDDAKVIVTVGPDMTGSVRVDINGSSYIADIENGKAVVTVPGLKEGTYEGVVTYLGDDKYDPSNNTFSLTVQAPIKVDVNGTGNESQVIIELPTNDTGNSNITVKIDGVERNFTVENGTVKANLTGLEPGEHNLTVIYTDENNVTSIVETKIIVPKWSSEVNATADTIREGDDAKVIVTVGPDMTGSVRVDINGSSYIADIENGKATVVVPSLKEGTYDGVVTYLGDDKYDPSNNTFSLTVQAPIKVEVNGTGNSSEVVIELPTNDTGNSNITVKIDGVERNFTVENGTVKANLTGLEPGEHNLTVIYTDENNVTSVVETKIVVPKWSSEVNATADTIREGDDATVVVSVDPDMTGSVRVDINGKGYVADIENGKATVVVPGLKEGTYDGVVTYLGDDKYDPSNNTFSLTVQAPIKVDVNGTGNESQVVIELPTNDTSNSNITVKIDGVERNFTVENGTVKANLTGLEPGEHNLTVIYTDENNVTSIVETKIIVPKWDSEVNATADTIREGDDAKVIVTVGPDMTGSVRVDIDGSSYIADIENGKAVVTVPGLKEGTYDGVVTYLGDDKYDPSNNTFSLTVQAPIKVDVNGTGNESQVVIELPTNDTSNSNITVKIDGVERNFTVENGTVKANLTGLEPGEHNLTVIYTDENNVTSVVETKIVVPKWDSEVNATADTIREGDDAKVIISVGPDMTGSVRVDIDGSSYVGDIENGKAVVTVPGLKEGTYDGVVTYLGDDKYNPSNNTFTLTVQAPIKVDVNGTGNSSEVVIVLPTNDTSNSNITVKIDGVERNYTVENGTVKANLTGLEPGEHNMTVIYTDENNVTSVVETKIIVPKWSSEVSASAPKIREGDDLPITVTVGPDMTGRVLVDLDGTGYYADIVDGKATIIAPGIKQGKYTANVTYLGDDRYDPSNNTFEVIVEAPITISVNGSGNNSQVVIELPENGTDNVTVTIDGKNLTVDVNNGTAVGNLTGLEPGEHNITVVYTDEDGRQSVVETKIIVPKWDSSVNATAATIREGDDANIIVTVGGKDMTGLIRVDIDGTGYYANVTNGTVTIIAPGLKAGKYDANVTYDGNAKYDPANNTFTLVVEPPISITVEGAGNSTQVIVDLPENGTDNVQVLVDGKPVDAQVVDGKAVVNLTNITAGDHNVTVIYTDANGTQSVVNKTITVYNSIKANDMVRGWNSPYDYEAEFLDKDGHVIANTVMELKVNGKTYKVKTDNKGIAKLTTSHLAIGKYDVEITNTLTHEKLTKTVTIVKRLIKNKDITMEFVDGTYYKVTAIGDDGKPVGKGEVVGIHVNGRDYVAITDANGVAKLKINLNPKTYTITAQYTNYKVSNKLVVKQTLKLVKKTITVKKSAKSFKIKATLKWASGKAIKGKKIVFKFKGKQYNAKTNSKGIAQVTIKKSVIKKLKKGKTYKFSAKYITNFVYGKVKVSK